MEDLGKGPTRRGVIGGMLGIAASASAEARELSEKEVLRTEKIRDDIRQAWPTIEKHFAEFAIDRFDLDALRTGEKHEHVAFIKELDAYRRIVPEILAPHYESAEYLTPGLRALDELFNIRVSLAPAAAARLGGVAIDDARKRVRDIRRLELHRLRLPRSAEKTPPSNDEQLDAFLVSTRSKLASPLR